MEVGIDSLTQRVERHSRPNERTYTLKQNVAIVKAEPKEPRRHRLPYHPFSMRNG